MLAINKEMSTPYSTQYQTTVGIWTNFTPTLTNISVGTGTVVAQKSVNGKIVNLFLELILGTGFSIGTTPQFSGFPVLDQVRMGSSFYGTIYQASTGNTYAINGYGISTSVVGIRHLHVSGQEISSIAITNLDPITFVAGDIITLNATYKTT